MITLYAKFTNEEYEKIKKACEITKRTKTNFTSFYLLKQAEKIITNTNVN